MGRKVFVSVLGTGFYYPCTYTYGEFVSSETRFIQSATLENIGVAGWKETDAVLVLLTSRARTDNWMPAGAVRLNRVTGAEETYKGLRDVLAEMALPCAVQEVDIPDGGQAAEMWKIFQSLYDAMQEGDELYIDLTHSFRYLPMLVLVLSNYTRFLKSTSVKYISYGNYEARDKELNRAPIVDLLPLVELQEWTFAAANLLQNGDADTVRSLCMKSLSPLLKDAAVRTSTPALSWLREFANTLKEVTDQMRGCRGLKILQGAEVAHLQELADKLDEVIIRPMSPVIRRISASFSAFSLAPDIRNGYEAAVWCFRHQLYQQSLTVLHENIVSHLCMEAHLDYSCELHRNVVNKAFRINSDQIPVEKWRVADEAERQIIDRLLALPLLQSLTSTFLVTTNLRNDFNHSGMRSNPITVNKLVRELEKRLQKITDLFLTPIC